MMRWLLLLLLLASCSVERQARRRCVRAERYEARAVWLCPPMLVRDSAAVLVAVAPDTAVARAALLEAQIDSLLLHCSRLAAGLSDTINALRAKQVTTTVAGMRRQLCWFEPFEVSAGLCTAKVRPDPEGPVVALTQAELQEERRVPCPPAVARSPVVHIAGVATWWRIAAIVQACAIFLWLFLRIYTPERR